MVSSRVVASDIGFTEGPVWTSGGRLLVTSISHGAIYEVAEGEAHVVAQTDGGPNGMAEGEDGTLYVTQNGGLYAGGTSPKPVTPGIQRVVASNVSHLAEGLDAPNDCCFGPDGRLYFTDPRGPADASNRRPGRVYAMQLEREPELLAEGPAFANGIAFGPDPSQLYVAETFRRKVLIYPVQGDGLGEPSEFCNTEPGFPDGLCFDQERRLYVAATLGEEVLVFDGAGQRIDKLPCGEGSMPTNCCFGGPEGRTLFVTDSRGERVLAFDLDVTGLPLFPFR